MVLVDVDLGIINVTLENIYLWYTADCQSMVIKATTWAETQVVCQVPCHVKNVCKILLIFLTREIETRIYKFCPNLEKVYCIITRFHWEKNQCSNKYW